MKKFLLIVLIILFSINPIFAATNDINQLFAPGDPTVDKGCGSYCPDDRIGKVDWTGDKISIIDLTTGAGFCNNSQPATQVKWSLCNCDASDEIEIAGSYGFSIEITTPGVSFEDAAYAGIPTITLREYKDKNDLCSNTAPSVKVLEFHLTNNGEGIDPNNTLITTPRKNLFDFGKLYISFGNLPRIIIDQRLVPYGVPITLRLGIFDASKVCAPDCSYLCKCQTIVAYMGCINDCCAVMPYLPLESGWWSGIAVSNISAHTGRIAVAFVNSNQKEIRNFDVGPFSILTIVPGEYMDKSCMAVIKSSFDMRVVIFGGTENMAFALPASSCSGCQ